MTRTARALALFLLLLSTARGGSSERDRLKIPVGTIDCTTVEVDAISPFLLDAFQRDPTIDIPKRVTEELEATPELICTSLVSSRHGDLPAIADAAAHRPVAEYIFPLLIERGAEARDALQVAAMRSCSRRRLGRLT